ncbi:MAG: hypothetical protein KA801_02275 [Syntrophorhabdaceae bacterium]|nr:hypothetical protein [Syntrophorhabdaceae bacterium]
MKKKRFDDDWDQEKIDRITGNIGGWFLMILVVLMFIGWFLDGCPTRDPHSGM